MSTIKSISFVQIIECVACINAAKIVVFGKFSGIMPIQSRCLVFAPCPFSSCFYFYIIMMCALFETMMCVTCKHAANTVISGIFSGILPSPSSFLFAACPPLSPPHHSSPPLIYMQATTTGQALAAKRPTASSQLLPPSHGLQHRPHNLWER